MIDTVTVRIDILVGEKRLAGTVVVPKTLYDNSYIDLIEISAKDLLSKILYTLKEEIDNE